MKKWMCFLATQKGYQTLKQAIDQGYAEQIGCVISFEETGMMTQYFPLIHSLCQSQSIDFFEWKAAKSQLPRLIETYDIHAAIAISWRFLLPLALNELLQTPLIVFHDSLLPKFRGFAPTPTAIMCGETTIGVSAIFACQEVDKGEIILQKKMEVAQDEYIASVLERQSQVYADMFLKIVEDVHHNSLVSYVQDEKEATYSAWRNAQDCHIHWEKSAIEIYNMIRAVSAPYPGAYALLEGEKIYIQRAEMVEDLSFAIRYPGKIWSLQQGQATVICGQGMLKITRAKKENGEDVVFDRLRIALK